MSEEQVKLTLAEYDKACAAGMSLNGWCSCGGPRDGNEYCPCFMHTLEILADGHDIIKTRWAEQGIHPREPNHETQEEYWARVDAESAAAIAKAEYEKMSPFRRKRLELIAAKEAAKRANETQSS